MPFVKAERWGVETPFRKKLGHQLGGRVAYAYVQPARVKACAPALTVRFPTSGFGRRPERNIGVMQAPADCSLTMPVGACMRGKFSTLTGLLISGLLACSWLSLANAAQPDLPAEPQTRFVSLPTGQIARVGPEWSEQQIQEQLTQYLDVDSATNIPSGYRVVQLQRRNRAGALDGPLYLMAFGPKWTDDQIRQQYKVDPYGFSPDFSVYKWGILAAAIALFLGVDVLANTLKPLPPGIRWKPTMYVGILAGVGLVAMQSTYRWDGISGQQAVDLTFQPLAAGIGSILPALFGALAIWFFVRWRARKALAQEPSATSQGPSPSQLVPRFLAQSYEPAKASDPFEIAGNEVLLGTMKAGLWARALVEGGDNDSATRSAYVRFRVAELQGKTVS